MPGRNFTDEQEAEIARRYLAGESAKAIGRSLGKRFHISICDALRRQGVEQRPAPERNRLYPLNPHVFDEIDNEHKAYWLGFLYADGCVSKRTLTVALQKKDAEHIDLLRDFMESSAPVKDQFRPGICDNRVVSFTDRHLAARLTELGISKGRTHPELMIEAIPTHLRPHFVRGFFDGDGCAHKDGSIDFCGDTAMMSWVRSVCAELAGTNPDLALTKHTKSDIYYVRFSGRIQALRVANMMYQDATIYLPRKKAVVDSWNQSPTRLHASGWKWHRNSTPTQSQSYRPWTVPEGIQTA